jgi:hypothetical protein
MYDFSTLYTTIPHDELKSRLLDIIDNCFFNKNRKKEIYLMISYQKHYIYKYDSVSTHKYPEDDIKNMLEFLIDNIYVLVGDITVRIPMGTNCAPFLSEPVFVFIRGGIHSKAPT